MTREEQWKPIPGFPDYEVANTGLVRSYKGVIPRILKPGGYRDSYRLATLMRNRKPHTFPIGQLVLLAFRGPCPEGCEMCHNDGDPRNDHLDNLRWDTHAANMHDRTKHYASQAQIALDTLMEDRTEHDFQSPFCFNGSMSSRAVNKEQTKANRLGTTILPIIWRIGSMIYNEPFVWAVRWQQEQLKMTQSTFARYLGVNQATLSKFYTRGIKDNLLIKILRKFPHLVVYLTSEDSNA